MHKPLVYNSQHKRHLLTASRASAERTRYCAVGRMSKRCVQCNSSAEWVRQEATEWLSGLGGVWGASVFSSQWQFSTVTDDHKTHARTHTHTHKHTKCMTLSRLMPGRDNKVCLLCVFQAKKNRIGWENK